MQQILEKFNFLPNDDSYPHKTCPSSSRVCIPKFAAVRLAVSEEIADREKRLSDFKYIDYHRY